MVSVAHPKGQNTAEVTGAYEYHYTSERELREANADLLCGCRIDFTDRKLSAVGSCRSLFGQPPF